MTEAGVGWESATVTLLSLVVLWLFERTKHNVPHNERRVVFRLGKYWGILEPGSSITVPFVDKVLRVELDKELPHWQGLNAEQIKNEIERRFSLRPGAK